MEKKLTAVERLEIELDRQGMIICFAWEDQAYFRKLLKQAKKREKEQIKNAYDSGCIGEVFELKCNESAEQYYKSRYGKE